MSQGFHPLQIHAIRASSNSHALLSIHSYLYNSVTLQALLLPCEYSLPFSVGVHSLECCVAVQGSYVFIPIVGMYRRVDSTIHELLFQLPSRLGLDGYYHIVELIVFVR